jgi:hypothetical protein
MAILIATFNYFNFRVNRVKFKAILSVVWRVRNVFIMEIFKCDKASFVTLRDFISLSNVSLNNFSG